MAAAWPGVPASARAACTDPSGGLGVARVVEIDARGGPLYGAISRQPKAAPLLAPMEVVLTFDDGPVPWTTRPVLAALEAACTRATFFSVGRMALAYPEMVREVLARGHTLGAHTWSHQVLIHLKRERALREIELGFSAVAAAAGQPIAPFFRFPGLNDSRSLVTHLAGRDIATFTVDVVTDDSFTNDAQMLTRRTLQRIEQRRGGIVLFHDIKPATAKALPQILAELKQRGYRVVHLVSARPAEVSAAYAREIAPVLAKAEARGSRLLPFVPTIGGLRPRLGDDLPDAAAAAADSLSTGTLPRTEAPVFSAWGRAFRPNAEPPAAILPGGTSPPESDWTATVRSTAPAQR